MQNTILTYNQMQSIKPCSQNNQMLLVQLINEVESFKIQKLIGADAYKSILNEINSGVSDELQKILDGGLYKCIAYFVYARYIQESMLVDTFTGVVTKQRTDSQTAPIGTLKNVANEYTDMAMYAYEQVKAAICERYNSKKEATPSNHFSEIQGIRRNVSYNKSKTKIIYM